MSSGKSSSRTGFRRRHLLPVALACALAVPAGARAQQGPRFLTDTLPPGDPIEILLARRAELGLSGEQVARLGEIQRQLHVANDPLVAQLVTLRHEVRGGGAVHPREMTPAQRTEFRAAARRARPLMQSIGRNNVQAMAQVGEVLTDQQKSLVRGWLPHTRGSPSGRGPHLRGGGGARGPFAPDAPGTGADVPAGASR